MMILTEPDCRGETGPFSISSIPSDGFELGVACHQPLGALMLEVDLDPRVLAMALDREHHAVAELLMAHPLAEPQAPGLIVEISAGASRGVDRARDVDARPDLLDELVGHLGDEARGRAVAVHAVHAPLLGVGQVQVAHGPRGPDVAQPAFLLEAGNVDDGTLM